MATVNEELQDIAIEHAIRLEAFKNGTAGTILGLLKDMDADLGRQLKKLGSKDAPVTAARVAAMRGQVADLTKSYTSLMQQEMSGGMQAFAGHEADFWMKALDSTAPINWSITQPSPQQLKAAATTTAFEGGLLGDQVAALGATVKRDLQSAITLGYAEGDSIGELTRRIRGTRATGYTDGVIQGIEAHRARALARTAVQSVAGEARKVVFEENADLVKGVQWVATLDPSTCLECAALDGKTWDTDDAPEIPLHWNCRCTLVPVVKSWEELGLPAQHVAEETRASMDGQIAGSPTFETWLKTKDESFQKEWLGEKRFDIWKAGTPLTGFVADQTKQWTLEDLRAAEQEKPVDPRNTFTAEMKKVQATYSQLPEAEQATVRLETGAKVGVEIERRISAVAMDVTGIEARRAAVIAEFDAHEEAGVAMAEKLGYSSFSEMASLCRTAPEFMEWAKNKNKIIGRYGAIEDELRAAYTTNKVARESSILETFSDIRPMGGNPFGRKPRAAPANDSIMQAAQFYPTAWLEASANAPKPLSASKLSGRSVYHPWVAGGGTKIETNCNAESSIHELAHRLEHTNPGILRAEHQFYDMRTKGQPLKHYPGGDPDEKIREGGFYDVYCGKDYKGQFYELLSTAWSQYVTHTRTAKIDEQFKAFILGLLSLE